MTVKLPTTHQPWVDPDDAPELTDEMLNKGIWMIGGREVSRDEGESAMRETIRTGRPKAEHPKQALTVRYDADVIRAFKASGKGWQTRMNAALRDWLKTHSPV